MKKIIFVILLISPFYVSAQSLTFRDLLSLENKPLSEINKFLIQKGWRYHENEKPDSIGNTYVSWGYFPKGEIFQAQSWVRVCFDFLNEVVGLDYQFADKKQYTQFINTLDKMGLGKPNSYLEDDMLKTAYTGTKYNYTFISNNSLSTGAPFTIMIYKNLVVQ